MPLSNAQYDEIMHEYDERQLHTVIFSKHGVRRF